MKLSVIHKAGQFLVLIRCAVIHGRLIFFVEAENHICSLYIQIYLCKVILLSVLIVLSKTNVVVSIFDFILSFIYCSPFTATGTAKIAHPIIPAARSAADIISIIFSSEFFLPVGECIFAYLYCLFEYFDTFFNSCRYEYSHKAAYTDNRKSCKHVEFFAEKKRSRTFGS